MSKWTIEPPTKPGLYWVRWVNDNEAEVVEVVEKHHDYDGMGVETMGFDVIFRLDEYAEERKWWSGPLTAPAIVQTRPAPKEK